MPSPTEAITHLSRLFNAIASPRVEGRGCCVVHLGSEEHPPSSARASPRSILRLLVAGGVEPISSTSAKCKGMHKSLWFERAHSLADIWMQRQMTMTQKIKSERALTSTASRGRSCQASLGSAWGGRPCAAVSHTSL